ncbi:uncharacterized protein [Physcomitrium patens]|nr:uncharacterized protein LOC112278759 isoform X3 [Physcomitrium patens]|eukprot:XP_024368256.1 uncharacterized protein LOC112278759 isoform X3 [Physcomitrella patens]
MAASCEMKDKLRVNSSASQVVVSTFSYPWSVKPSFSFVSYFFPIRGNKRLSYLTAASILLFLLWITLAQIAHSRASFVYLTVFLATQNIAAAMLDVVVNVVVAGAARARRIDFDLQPISWFSMIFGGIVGRICGELELPVFNVEGIFLFLSVFPLLQLLACDLLDVKTRNHVATAIDEGSYNLLEFDYWMISTDILEESHVEMDCYGILNGVSEEEEYSDTIILQAVDKERHISDYDGVATVLRLPWRIDHGEGFVGKVEKSFAPPTEEVKRQHDGEDDGDWIEIGLNGLEKGSELAENIGGSDIKEDMHKSFISDADDPIEDLHLQVKELPRNSEQLNEKPRSSSGRPKVFKSEQVVQRGLWQELRSTVADILKQPVLMQ